MMPTFSPGLISAAGITQVWSSLSPIAKIFGVSTLLVLVSADANDEALDEAASKWRAAKLLLDDLREALPVQGTVPLTSWSGTQDRPPYDEFMRKLSDELGSLVQAYEDNAKTVEESKKFFNEFVLNCVFLAVAVMAVFIAWQAVRAIPIVGPPTAEAGMAATGGGALAAYIGLAGSLIGVYSSGKSLPEGSEKATNWHADSAPGTEGADLQFEDIRVDWSTATDNPILQ